jgi:hypothetical protein
MRRLALAILIGLGAAAGCGGGGGGSGGWHTYTASGTFGVGALWAFAPNDVWVGGQVMLHFDGSAFSQVQTPRAGYVADFWGLAPDDLYAVSGTSLMHWDGSAWSVIDFGTAIDPTDLAAVWATSRDDLWLGDSLNGRVFHWNGTTWSTGITQTVQVTDLWGVAGGPVYAVGIFGMSRWSGGVWSDIGDSVADQAAAVWGFAANDVWAVGDFGTLAHWDGTKWTDTVPPNDDRFQDSHQAVWGAASDDVWAVGDGGAISHWNGSGWSQIQVGAFPYYPFLGKVHGSSASDVWVAGRSSDGKNTGVILHHQP